MRGNGENEMGNAVKVSIGIACVSVLVLSTGGVPAGNLVSLVKVSF